MAKPQDLVVYSEQHIESLPPNVAGPLPCAEARPSHIHDYEEDDPNLQLFGSISDNGFRKLEATVHRRKNGKYAVKLKYTCLPGSQPARGHYVTFITYPGFGQNGEDAYELFSPVKNGVAENEIYPTSLFTVAAIGDAGDTVLTLDLEKVRPS